MLGLSTADLTAYIEAPDSLTGQASPTATTPTPTEHQSREGR